MEGKGQYKRGLWTAEEDKILMDYIRVHGKGRWNRVAKMTGLKRCGKSCRLRWINYLSPSVKKGDFTEEEEDLIIRLHKLLGNRWSLIAGRVPGRTDNQVKNHWNTHLCKKLGINKNQRKYRVSSPATAQNKRSKNEDVGFSPDSNLKLPYCDSNGGAMGVPVNEFCKGVAESSYTPELTPSEYLEGSCWFSNADWSVNQWNLMELTDVWPLELLWNDL